LAACAGHTPTPQTVEEGPANAALDDVLVQASADFDARMGSLCDDLPVAEALTQSLATRQRGEVHVDSVAEHYEAHQMKPLLLERASWTDRAQAVLDALIRAPDHALNINMDDVSHLRHRTQQLQAAVAASDQLCSFEPTRADWLRTRERLLRDDTFNPDDSDALDQLFTRLRQQDARNPMPRLAGRLRNITWTFDQRLQLAAQLELDLTINLARYASAMRLQHHHNATHLDMWRTIASDDTIHRTRLAAFLNTLRRDGHVALLTLWPQHPSYGPLVQARRKYAQLAQRGGWDNITFSKRMRKGRSHESIIGVKQRLALEGYFTGTINDEYDRDLINAIKRYQETHQHKADGELDPKLIKNLNMSVEQRLATIDVTLRRYHRSRLGAFDYYLFVNIPDFHVEIWRGGQRQMRLRIVVGNNVRLRDTATGKVVRDGEQNPVYANRTPMQIGFMRHVIYNPYWNVPPRIKSEELDVKQAADETYYDTHNFEYIDPLDPDSPVRQKPGPGNTLGRVKFIFPNRHNTYLHDTAAKKLFGRPVRAFSHGCMRVQTPLDLAERLLTNDGQFDSVEVSDLLNTRPYRERAYRLRRSVPVHVDYFNTRVTDDGHVAFLSDIYKYDRSAIKARTAELEQHYREATPTSTASAD